MKDSILFVAAVVCGLVSTDLTIEQVMMKSLKSQGGLTHGRGMSESVRLTWVKTMHKCATMHSAIASLTDTGSDEVHHADTYSSSMKLDVSDLHKIIAWFETNNPFNCLLYTSPSPRDRTRSRMPSSA